MCGSTHTVHYGRAEHQAPGQFRDVIYGMFPGGQLWWYRYLPEQNTWAELWGHHGHDTGRGHHEQDGEHQVSEEQGPDGQMTP